MPQSLSSKVANVLVMLLFLAGTVSSFPAFPRFEMIHLALATLFMAALGAAWIVSAWQREAGTVRRRKAWSLAAMALLLIWIAVLGGSSGLSETGDVVARWSLPFVLLLWAVRDERHAPSQGVILGLSLSLTVSGLLALGQALGVSILQVIPTTLPDAGGYAGPFDDIYVAAAFGGLGSLALLALTRRAADRLKPLALVGAVAGALLVGLSGQLGVALLLTFAGLLIAGLGRDDAEAKPALRAALVGAVLAPLLVWAGPRPEVAGTPVVAELGVSDMLNGEEPTLDPGNLAFYRDVAARFAVDGLPIGHGPGTYFAEGEGAVDFDEPYARAHADEVPIGRRAAVPVLQIAGELGVLGLLLLGGLFVFLFLEVRKSQDGRAEKLSALIGAVAMFWLSPGLLATGAMLAFGAVIYALAHDDAGEGEVEVAAWQGRMLLAGLVVVLAAGGLFVQQRNARSAYFLGKGIVFLDAGYLPEAQAALSTAEAIHPSYEASWNLGMSLVYAPEEIKDLGRGLDALAHAAQLRPAQAHARFVVGDINRRYTPEEISSTEDFDTLLDEADRLFSRSLEMNPNGIDAALALAQVHMIRLRSEDAIAVLRSVADRDVEGENLWRLHFELGRLYDEVVEDPVLAMEYYRKAADRLPLQVSARDLGERMAEMDAWIQGGSRPTVQDTHHAHDQGPSDQHDQRPSSVREEHGGRLQP